MVVARTSQNGDAAVSAASSLPPAPVVGMQVNYRCPTGMDITSLSPALPGTILPAFIVGTASSLGASPPAPYVLTDADHVHLLVLGPGSVQPVFNVAPGVAAGQWSYPAGS